MTKGDSSRAGSAVRCAIYTRKSSDEGLEQEFNSLDAQREACEAYIVSQRHAGWIALPDMYDDGGLSGGDMGRPALQRLLADVKKGKLQTIVVYKVDRLTRSLADFAKIVDVLDASGTSFVSVTQQFNTTTSMGRLTLNMLLSFAQFEREIAGERIRAGLDANALDAALNRAAAIAHNWRAQTGAEAIALLLRIIERVVVEKNRVTIEMSPEGLLSALGATPQSELPSHRHSEPITLTFEMALRRAGKEKRLVIGGANDQNLNPALIALIAKSLTKIRLHLSLGSRDTGSVQASPAAGFG